MSHSVPNPLHVPRPMRVSILTIVLAIIALGTFIAILNPDIFHPNDTSPAIDEIAQASPGYDGMPIPPPPLLHQIYPVSIQQINPVGVPGGYIGPNGYVSTTTYDTAAAGTSSAYPNHNPDASIIDTREFLKVRYDAVMRTRNVQEITRRVEESVRGHGGRIDQDSSSSEVGYVSFVVPMNTYDAFRTEIESMVDRRFLSVKVNSENLLSQKQGIEEQQKQADDSLANYKTARQTMIDTHITTLNTLQAQIDREATQLVSLRAQTQTPEIQAQIQGVLDDIATLREAIINTNTNYKEQLGYADNNIKNAEDWQSSVKAQDKTLTNNVGTVSGSVSLQWISVWNIALVYLPGYWIPTIFTVLAFLSYLWDRRRFDAWRRLSA